MLYARERISDEDYRALVPTWSVFARGELSALTSEFGEELSSLREVGSGWPAISLLYTIQWPVNGRRPYVIAGITLPESIKHFSHLPCRPVFMGFAINTIFYAAILWLLFAAPGKVRRWRRSKRGLCPACAYPIGSSDTCTECGATVMPTARRL